MLWYVLCYFGVVCQPLVTQHTYLTDFQFQLTEAQCAVTALVFTEKIGVLPERIFESMFNDRLVAKGTILLMVTDIFRQFIAITASVDDLVVLLTKAKIANRLLDYFPPGQQTEAAFQEHFQKEGLDKLVCCCAIVCAVFCGDGSCPHATPASSLHMTNNMRSRYQRY